MRVGRKTMNYVLTYVSRLLIGGGWQDGDYVEGRGSSQKQAEFDCLQNLKRNLDTLVELADGVLLPIHMVEEIPKELPMGLELVIFERSFHCSGDPYDWRFFALRPGFYSIDGQGFEVTAGRPAKVNTLDSNSDVTYRFPEGSMEYVDGAWLPSTSVEYHY
jgi:hypothetical protein